MRNLKCALVAMTLSLCLASSSFAGLPNLEVAKRVVRRNDKDGMGRRDVTPTTCYPLLPRVESTPVAKLFEDRGFIREINKIQKTGLTSNYEFFGNREFMQQEVD